jgi:hypothetical protein
LENQVSSIINDYGHSFEIYTFFRENNYWTKFLRASLKLRGKNEAFIGTETALAKVSADYVDLGFKNDIANFVPLISCVSEVCFRMIDTSRQNGFVERLHTLVYSSEKVELRTMFALILI